MGVPEDILNCAWDFAFMRLLHTIHFSVSFTLRNLPAKEQNSFPSSFNIRNNITIIIRVVINTRRGRKREIRSLGHVQSTIHGVEARQIVLRQHPVAELSNM